MDQQRTTDREARDRQARTDQLAAKRQRDNARRAKVGADGIVATAQRASSHPRRAITTTVAAEDIVAGDTVVGSAYGYDLLVEAVRLDKAGRVELSTRRIRTNGSLGAAILPIYNRQARVQVVHREVAA